MPLCFSFVKCACGAGAPIVGDFDRSGIGEPVNIDDVMNADELWHDHVKNNSALVETLREDANADWLFEHTKAEARLGRMSGLVEATPAVVSGCVLQPRFAVSQARPDGSVKLRAVDHFSWSDKKGKAGSVNGCAAPAEKLKHDTLDALADAMCLFVERVQEVPWLYKADIKEAFRRVPVKPEHRKFCGVAFKQGNQVRVLSVAHLALLLFV